MMYATLLAQAAIIASLALLGGPPASTGLAANVVEPPRAASVTLEKAKLRCRLYFGCAPSSVLVTDSPPD